MSAIIAGILAVIMIAGGIIPNYTNNKVEEIIKTSFNNPEKVDVKVYSTPSYKILGGHYDRVEINVKKPTFANIQFDSIKVVTSPLKFDYEKGDKGLDFIKEGNLDALIIVSPENIAKAFDLNSLTNRVNNFLSNFDLPIPMLSGNVSVDGLGISFVNNKPSISGNFIALGGLVSAPFSLTGDIRVNNDNKIELYRPQFTVMGEALVMDQMQDMVKYINPIFDINTMNSDNLKIKLKRLYFSDNKLKLIGNVDIKTN